MRDKFDLIIDKIHGSVKYRNIARSTIRDVVERADVGKPKVTEAAARKKLHLILADYHIEPKLSNALTTLEELAANSDLETTQELCRQVLVCHKTSTERLKLLDQGYYDAIYEVTGVPTRVMDLAAALHPFEHPWMNLPGTTSFEAYDNNRMLAGAVNRFLGARKAGAGYWRDILVDPLEGPVDIAYFLMTYHCLEARRRGSGWAAIMRASTTWTVVSLPRKSFARRGSGRFDAMARDLECRIGDVGFQLHKLEWDTELTYIFKSL